MRGNKVQLSGVARGLLCFLGCSIAGLGSRKAHSLEHQHTHDRDALASHHHLRHHDHEHAASADGDDGIARSLAHDAHDADAAYSRHTQEMVFRQRWDEHSQHGPILYSHSGLRRTAESMGMVARGLAHMLKQITHFLTENDIRFCISSGTLLGYLRYHGLHQRVFLYTRGGRSPSFLPS